MSEARSSLSDFERHSLFEACTREAERIGGDERTAEYFFERAQSSRIWMSSHGAVTIADMDISDWCGAIAWSAPGVGRRPGRAGARGNGFTAPTSSKQPRSGAKYRRSHARKD